MEYVLALKENTNIKINAITAAILSIFAKNVM